MRRAAKTSGRMASSASASLGASIPAGQGDESQLDHQDGHSRIPVRPLLDRLDDLEKLLKLCRRQGVHEITFDGCTAKLGELPPPMPRRGAKEKDAEENPDVDPMTGLTNEQLMYLSAEPGP